MPTDILPEFAASAQLPITLAGLASSTTGVGRQSDMIANGATRKRRAHVWVKVTTGTTPTAGKRVYIYRLKGDGAATPVRTDGAGASDAGLTRVSAELLDTITVDGTSDKTYIKDLILEDLGPEWGLLITHDTVAALNANAANHGVYYVLENDESQ